MPKVNNFSAWITVDGKPLADYGVEVDEETQTVSCWIPSEAGKAYIVRWRNHNFRSPTIGRVQVDGYHSGGYVNPTASWLEGHVDGVYITSTTMAPFTFSQVQTSDDQALLSAPAAPDVGLITLRIYNVRVLERGVPWSNVAPPEARTYHEKTKKGISHQTSFQRTVTVPAVTDIKTEAIGGPVAVFHFRYRPLAILQAQEIAPRLPVAQHSSTSGLTPSSPSPSGSRKRVKIELDSDGEVIAENSEDENKVGDTQQSARIQKQIDTLRAKQKKGEHPRKRIKREPVVVDLTADE
ncbi:hypothetical protein L218DRAFT_1079585 [Marasmius fiardii PR-910]|nr:hypothetical protein L218DRAFT_1079585 [Marasmius fiardii PR-910]